MEEERSKHTDSDTAFCNRSFCALFFISGRQIWEDVKK